MSTETTGPLAATALHWSGMAQLPNAARAPFSWLDAPLVQRLYVNPAVAGNPDENWLAAVKQRHLPRTVARGLTLGCGSGGLERHAAFLRLCEHYDAFDVASGAIEAARAAAAAAGLANATYAVADLNEAEFPPSTYDVAFASMAVHHIERLEHLFDQVHRSLKPGSLFVINEFVGPTRFQWTRRQLLVMNAVLRLIPPDLRRSLVDGQTKTRIVRPSISEMIRIDPSEAVRSAEIVPLLLQRFTLVDRVDYGGTVLHILLQDIVGNFSADRPRDVKILRRIFRLERALIRSRLLPSDFAVLVLGVH